LPPYEPHSAHSPTPVKGELSFGDCSNQEFGNLYRVQCGPFEQLLVTTDPECQPIVQGGIEPDPANLAIVIP
jgi:hypothetical protein